VQVFGRKFKFSKVGYSGIDNAVQVEGNRMGEYFQDQVVDVVLNEAGWKPFKSLFQERREE
jgi:hypothetical protein